MTARAGSSSSSAPQSSISRSALMKARDSPVRRSSPISSSACTITSADMRAGVAPPAALWAALWR